jgi:hypothetical protein
LVVLLLAAQRLLSDPDYVHPPLVESGSELAAIFVPLRCCHQLLSALHLLLSAPYYLPPPHLRYLQHVGFLACCIVVIAAGVVMVVVLTRLQLHYCIRVEQLARDQPLAAFDPVQSTLLGDLRCCGRSRS